MSDLKSMVEFLNESPDFCFALEAVKLYQQMHSEESPIAGHYNIENQDQLFTLASKFGYQVEWEKVDSTWMKCNFYR